MWTLAAGCGFRQHRFESGGPIKLGYFVGARMMITHSSAEATLWREEELVVLVLLPPGPILTEVPPEPAVAEPLRLPAPTEEDVELDVDVEPEPAPEEPLAVVPAFSVRHGCWLSTMIVVPPLLPLTIETLAPPPAVEVVESAKASVAEPAPRPAPRRRPQRPMMARISIPSLMSCVCPLTAPAAK